VTSLVFVEHFRFPLTVTRDKVLFTELKQAENFSVGAFEVVALAVAAMPLPISTRALELSNNPFSNFIMDSPSYFNIETFGHHTRTLPMVT
jgi:hypothetical protein